MEHTTSFNTLAGIILDDISDKHKVRVLLLFPYFELNKVFTAGIGIYDYFNQFHFLHSLNASE